MLARFPVPDCPATSARTSVFRAYTRTYRRRSPCTTALWKRVSSHHGIYRVRSRARNERPTGDTMAPPAPKAGSVVNMLSLPSGALESCHSLTGVLQARFGTDADGKPELSRMQRGEEVESQNRPRQDEEENGPSPEVKPGRDARGHRDDRVELRLQPVVSHRGVDQDRDRFACSEESQRRLPDQYIVCPARSVWNRDDERGT